MDEASKFPAHEAARAGHVNVADLLSGKANPKLAHQKDSDEREIVHWACSYNRIEVVKLLMQAKNFDIDVQDGSSGYTPLMFAVSIQDGDDLVDLLLSKGADVNMTNFNGQAALHFAASKNNLDVAKKLIEYKASTCVKDRRSTFPIHRAAAIGSVPMIDLFLKNRSPINSQDLAGYTPLHHSIAEGHGHCAIALLKAGAETDKKDADGFLALDLAPDAQVRKFIIQTAEREGIEL